MNLKKLKPALPLQLSYQNLKRRLLDTPSLILSEQLPYQVIAHYHKAEVRYYASQHPQQRIPVVLVAPLAVKMAIYDLFPYRSLIRYLTTCGFDVYLINWGALTRDDADLDFNYFIFDALTRMISSIKQHAQSDEISLQGWSMAGIFCLMYAASGIDSGIRNLLIFASPINCYASGNIGKGFALANRFIESSSKVVQDTLLFRHIPNRFIHTPGFLNSLGFKILNPLGIIQGHLQLLRRARNIEDVKSHATLGDFLNNMIDYPGAINRDMMLWIWLKNPFFSQAGSFHYKGRDLDLNKINSNLLIGAGSSDGMVTPASVQPLTNLTASQDVTFKIIPGGHMGLMCSQASSLEFWPFLSNWLEQRSMISS